MHKKIKQIKKSKVVPVDPALVDRVPPGQIVTERFPILHEGEVPKYELEQWSLKVFGEVNEEKIFTHEDIMEMPQNKVVNDIHCVTRWSKLDNEWEGVLFQDLLSYLDVKPEAKHVMIYGDYDYDANIPLSELQRDGIILAHKHGGEDLTAKHGWPLRLVVPQLYFWKSVKWIRAIEFMKEDRHGYWEVRGFHNEAEPFKEQRFSGEDLEIPEDEWEKKEYD
ncbi:sulfite oxidase-like oxidoreductase [Pseudalkalibacillus decolorationis]|uniref:sulfite oxidase-like oxidoreductase n=1 Tax=Pseudalkalibacillus decolorationis TaxID=163879 RepID=UPI00214783F8|nr:sulfite oxidase-like oxidoreductase [Pseudalkalibacillus decolorationis]